MCRLADARRQPPRDHDPEMIGALSERTKPAVVGQPGLPARILTVHNTYQQAGGEDLVFLEEAALLESHGHRVVCYEAHNDRIQGMGRAELVRDTIWNQRACREIGELIRRESPDVVHLHNTFPLISPAVAHAAAREGVPVVQTLHNYRLLCPNGLLFRGGQPCEQCLGRTLRWPGIVHGCYRGSRAATGAVAGMLLAHRAVGTWSRRVTAYIALSDFARRKFIEDGLPAGKVFVKPNFVARDPGCGEGSGGYALFVGRLSPEKGVKTLLEAWKLLGGDAIPLKIAGDGPLSGEVSRAAAGGSRVEWLGHGSPQEIRALMKDATTLVFPSEWYETFGRVVIEAFAAGTPVLAAGTGAAAELVEHGRTGLLFRTRDPADLARLVRWLAHNPREHARMRREAREEYERRYTAERNYELLIGIYRQAMEKVVAGS
ncbi:glycosyltransferase [Rubrobacter calidifluminis]|uniref:glycosyltransferase n=1 Tax=Rubrobacter calidifluminis TaxID=1392640 RepID=UPI00235F85B2|nr:glycosyltransferase [Rubrobacter calidifluminis]